MQKLLLIVGSDQNYSWPESPIFIFPLIREPDTKIILIRISCANITFDYRFRSSLLLTTVFDTKTSLDQCARYRDYFWSEFLVQTLLLIKGSNQNYSWPESPIKIFLLISLPDTEVTPDQSFWCKHYSWLYGLIEITPDQNLLYINFSWSVCPIPKLLQIRVSGAKFTLDYRVRSKLLQDKVSDTNISLDQFARYRNYSWSEFLVQTLLLIIGSDHKTLEQSFRYI